MVACFNQGVDNMSSDEGIGAGEKCEWHDGKGG
jgi:hypothetical protein